MSASNGSSHHAATPFHNPRTLLSSVKYHVQHWVNLVIYNSIYQNLFLLYLYRIFKFLYGLLDHSTELSRICGANPGASTPLDALWDEDGNVASPLVLDRQGGTIAYSCGLVSRRLAAAATARAKALSLAMGRRGSVQAGTATVPPPSIATPASSRDSSESSSTGSDGEKQTLVGSTRTSLSTKHSDETALGAELHEPYSPLSHPQQLLTHRRTVSSNSNGGSKKRESSTSSSGSNESIGTTTSTGGYAGVKMDLRQSRSAAGLIYRIDRCILFSKQLTVERRELETPDCVPEYITQQILRKKRFPEGGSPSTPAAKKLQYAIDRIAATHQLAREINQRVHTKYDSTNNAHEWKLTQLWDLLCPNEKLVSRYTKQWTEIGFQGKDPATDFRGMGMLGLDDLVYYAKHYPVSSKYTLECSHHETSWYSFAIVGINITSFAVQTLRTRQLQYYLFLNGAEISVYHEFYCYLFHRFNSYWSTLEPKPSIMDFERVFADFKVTMERQLTRRKLMMLKADSKESYPTPVTVPPTPVVRGRKISNEDRDKESLEMETRKNK
ncbi:ELMO domain-containing protein [Entomortierella parvispora]|uniref:ELMO domain-containing protein n=1 Tax=Entomortierella parvispora TaxID=205924 RepID=A0A9P3HL89_9FUNG|nr:ELMO domain-containing protein [Entomortierella parvispora]